MKKCRNGDILNPFQTDFTSTNVVYPLYVYVSVYYETNEPGGVRREGYPFPRNALSILTTSNIRIHVAGRLLGCLLPLGMSS